MKLVAHIQRPYAGIQGTPLQTAVGAKALGVMPLVAAVERSGDASKRANWLCKELKNVISSNSSI